MPHRCMCIAEDRVREKSVSAAVGSRKMANVDERYVVSTEAKNKTRYTMHHRQRVQSGTAT